MGRYWIKNLRSEWWTAVFTGTLAVATLFALWYARGQLMQAHEEAQVQHLLQLAQQFQQEPMISYRQRLAEKRLKNEEEPPELYVELDFFEMIGLLVNRGYLDESDVWTTFSYPVFNLYTDTSDIIEQYRQDDPNAYTNFISLVRRLQRIETEHHGTIARLRKDQVMDFYREELKIGVGAPIESRGRLAKQPKKQ